MRTAYMLAYYPFYIETIHRVLDRINAVDLAEMFFKQMEVCFYGAGPAPEMLGFVSYLKLHQPQVEKLQVFLFDAARHWHLKENVNRAGTILVIPFGQSRVK